MTINKGSTTPDIDMFEDFLEEKKCSYISCVPQKTHSQQAMTKVKYVLVPDVK
jgi:hypothetical protein